MQGFGDHSGRWVAIMAVALAASFGLRLLARWGTRRGEARLAAARQALGLGRRDDPGADPGGESGRS